MTDLTCKVFGDLEVEGGCMSFRSWWALCEEDGSVLVDSEGRAHIFDSRSSARAAAVRWNGWSPPSRVHVEKVKVRTPAAEVA